MRECVFSTNRVVSANFWLFVLIRRETRIDREAKRFPQEANDCRAGKVRFGGEDMRTQMLCQLLSLHGRRLQPPTANRQKETDLKRGSLCARKGIFASAAGAIPALCLSVALAVAPAALAQDMSAGALH